MVNTYYERKISSSIAFISQYKLCSVLYIPIQTSSTINHRGHGENRKKKRFGRSPGKQLKLEARRKKKGPAKIFTMPPQMINGRALIHVHPNTDIHIMTLIPQGCRLYGSAGSAVRAHTDSWTDRWTVRQTDATHSRKPEIITPRGGWRSVLSLAHVVYRSPGNVPKCQVHRVRAAEIV